MATVINKNAIEKRIAEFYELVECINESNLAPSLHYTNKIDLNRIKVDKVSAYADFRIGVGGYDVEEEDDEDMVYDYELCNAWALSIAEGFDILPSKVFINANDRGVIFEWSPEKPIYISSIEEYCKLYQSFAEFLEGSCLVDSSPSPDEFEICFLALDMSMFSENSLKSEDKIPTADKTFTKENFSSQRTIICTHDRIVSYYTIAEGFLGRIPMIY